MSHHILACPRLAPDVGETEEGERGGVPYGVGLLSLGIDDTEFAEA
jgi:hypothetical protein